MNNTSSPQQYLYFILLGSILGMAGQVIRILVGIKKAKTDAKSSNQEFSFDSKQMLITLMIALIVGGIAGVLVAVNSVGKINSIDKSTIIAFIAAGYAGTDLIEGFVIH